MMLFRSNSGQGGESLLLNFAAGSVFHTSWQAGESTYIAAESPVGQLLLLSWVYDDLSDNWFQTYQQYLAPASDPTIMTPVGGRNQFFYQCKLMVCSRFVYVAAVVIAGAVWYTHPQDVSESKEADEFFAFSATP